MYPAPALDNLFTGYYDAVEGEYIYPSARQNFVIVFDDFYLSADGGDFTTDGINIQMQTGPGEDFTWGNATAKVLSATMLNPDGVLRPLNWGYGQAYVSVVTASSPADYADLPCFVMAGGSGYGLDDNGNAVINTTTYTLGGDPRGVVVYSDGTAYFVTDENAGYWDGTNFSVLSAMTATDRLIVDRLRRNTDPLGVVVDASGRPYISNDVNADTKEEFSFVPMGIYNFSGVEAYETVFTADAYDKMTTLDADAIDWVETLDFTTPIRIDTMLTQMLASLGFAVSIDPAAPNQAVTLSENPFLVYTVTYRQILKWFAEMLGCNARMARDSDTVELVAHNRTYVAEIRPDVIIASTRTEAHDTTNGIGSVFTYTTNGLNMGFGPAGLMGQGLMYIVGNPILCPASQTEPSPEVINNFNDYLEIDHDYNIARFVPYTPLTISLGYSDPRLDAGDVIRVRDVGGRFKAIPVMDYNFSWSNISRGTIAARGRKERKPPADVSHESYASVVNTTNILQGVDARRITVRDEYDNIIFHADADTHEAEIGGFVAGDGELRQTNGSDVVVLDGNGLSASDGTDTTAVSAGGTSATDGTNTITTTPTEITLEDGTYTKVIDASGPTTNGENSSTSPSVPSDTDTELASFTVSEPGVYLVSATARFSNNANGYRKLWMRRNNVGSATNMSRELQVTAAAVNGEQTAISIAAVQQLAQGDVVRLYGRQNSGVNVTALWAYHYTRLA